MIIKKLFIYFIYLFFILANLSTIFVGSRDNSELNEDIYSWTSLVDRDDKLVLNNTINHQIAKSLNLSMFSSGKATDV